MATWRMLPLLYIVEFLLFVSVATAAPVTTDGIDNKAKTNNYYNVVNNNVKCSANQAAGEEERIFRTRNDEPLTFEQCAMLCYNTEDCHYFSLGTESVNVQSLIGVCIGCKEESKIQNHHGFDTYEINSKQQEFSKSPSSCLMNDYNDDDITFPINGCDYDAFLDGIDEYLKENYWLCPDKYDAHDIMDDLFDNPIDVVNEICTSIWNNEIPQSTFQDVDSRFDDQFMEEYIDGDTFLNHETGSFQGTEEGENIDRYRNDEATNRVLEGIPSLSSCANNAIMCCFGRDRQPNDNNGNCKEPIDTKCHHADPADNSNLCWTDSSNVPAFSDPFAFPEKSEGPTHCHGLAWTEDENSFEARLRYNNFFFVSLYDHMYTRGYVEPMVDSNNIGMCRCVEEMPVVSRADCTQVDATQTFTVTYTSNSNDNDENYFVVTKKGDMNVEFNSCKGIDPSTGNKENNDLASYVYRLNQEGKLSDAKKEGVFQTLYGYASPNDNQNEEGCEEAYLAEFQEEYPDDVGGFKCSQSNDVRLFRTPNDDPLTLEECQNLCYETQFCDYFSLGVSARGNDHGVCIGCTTLTSSSSSSSSSDTILVRGSGFNSYQMTSTQQFSTPTPTDETDAYDVIATNKKCPQSSQTRLFVTSDLTREECYERCYNTEGCHYFSLGEYTNNENWIGLCMGCTADAVLSDHDGFTAFEMEVFQNFPTPAPSHESDTYDVIATNKKCPHGSKKRLFKTPDMTREECYDRCYNTEGCRYFSLGEHTDNKKWMGLCMGCTADAVLSDHNGFNAFEMKDFENRLLK